MRGGLPRFAGLSGPEVELALVVAPDTEGAPRRRARVEVRQEDAGLD